MSGGTAPPVRVMTFADPEGRLWGGALDPGSGPLAVLGGPGGPLADPAGGLTLARSGSEWQLAGAGLELTVSGLDAGAGPGVRLATVTGSVRTGDGELALSCPAVWGEEPADGPLQAVRAVAGFFDELAFGLHAVRPARAKGQEADRLRASLFEGDAVTVVDEPRLSTTVRDDGVPARTSLELWVGEGDDLYPRRAAAEASGPPAFATAGGVELVGVPLRCHAAGREGTGVYLIARVA